MRNTVFAVFSDETDIKPAVNALVEAGFNRGLIDYTVRPNSTDECRDPFLLERFFRQLFPAIEALEFSAIASSSAGVVSVQCEDHNAELASDVLKKFQPGNRTQPLRTANGESADVVIVERQVEERFRLREERVAMLNDLLAHDAHRDLESLFRKLDFPT